MLTIQIIDIFNLAKTRSIDLIIIVKIFLIIRIITNQCPMNSLTIITIQQFSNFINFEIPFL
jgi:hypothetical protein